MSEQNIILFLSAYPTTSDMLREGFYQRVANIDQFWDGHSRTYLSIAPFHNVKAKKTKTGQRTLIECNFFVHFFLILSLFKKASFIYIQSLYNALYTLPFIYLFKKKYILDLHGVVPEELALQQQPFRSRIFNGLERLVFKKLDTAIVVSKRMENHYKKKYPKAKIRYIHYAILPTNLQPVSEVCLQKYQNTSTVNILYSGNTQAWQNIELMLRIIKENLHSNFIYTILTGEREKMHQLLKQHDLDEKIILKSVSPDELETFYLKNHYGFILRDDILINNVACPTKMIEYMNYGMIPIVLSDNIGDFSALGYERILSTAISSNLEPKKSHLNARIIQTLKQSIVQNLKEYI